MRNAAASITWVIRRCPAIARSSRSWPTCARSSIRATAAGRTCTWATSAYHVGDLIDSLHDRLTQQIARALRHDCKAQDLETDFEAEAQEIAIRFLEQIPELRRMLADDAQAAYDGDPAAKSLDEIVFCYPGVAAITVFRIAP